MIARLHKTIAVGIALCGKTSERRCKFIILFARLICRQSFFAEQQPFVIFVFLIIIFRLAKPVQICKYRIVFGYFFCGACRKDTAAGAIRCGEAGCCKSE